MNSKKATAGAKFRIAMEDAHSVFRRYEVPLRVTAKALQIGGQLKNSTSAIGLLTSALGGVTAMFEVTQGLNCNTIDNNYFTTRGFTTLCRVTANLLDPFFDEERKPIGFSGNGFMATTLDGKFVGLWTNEQKVLIGCFAKEEDKEHIWKSIHARFREKFPGVATLSKIDIGNSYYGDSDKEPYFLSHDDRAVFHTPKSDELAARIRNFNARGVSRSLLIYGRPGTGKTTVGRAIVDRLGYRTLRATTESYRLPTGQLKIAIESLGFEAFLLDDVDRIGTSEDLLEFMEWAKEHLKLVIYTANKPEGMDTATRRPGRIDERYLVDALDEKLVKTMLGPDNVAYFEQVKNWPVAYLNEFVFRRGYSDKDEDAQEWIQELDESQIPPATKPVAEGAATPPNANQRLGQVRAVKG